VIDAFRQFRERHVSVLALITSLGFRQDRIEYEKQPRLHGTSGWSVRRKIKLVLDSLTAFSSLPITVCWASGAVMTLAAILLAVLGFSGTSIGVLTPSDVVLVAAVGGVGGLGLVMLGIVGEYVWRALDESRRRPRYVVEARTAAAAAPVEAIGTAR
jgi:dolichol-phosphate mannosyltransferase